MRTKYGLLLLLLVCILTGILCSIVGACITRNVAEAATEQKCERISESYVGNYYNTHIRCPEGSYRCFRSPYSSGISCVPTGR